MKTKTTTFLWFCGILTALFVTQSAFADIETRPGSEYNGEIVIRDPSNPSSDPKPFKLTITTLANGNVGFLIESADGTPVTWRDQAIIVDSDNAQLWRNGGTGLLRDYFEVNKLVDGQMVQKPDKKSYFELVPKTTIPSDAIIVYKSGLTYWYGNESRGVEPRNKHNYIIYTYGTTPTDGASSICKYPVVYGNDKQGSSILFESTSDGIITATIQRDDDKVIKFRNNGLNDGEILLGSYSTPSFNGAVLSTYYDRNQNNNIIVYTPKAGVTIPSDLRLSYFDSWLEWNVVGLEGNAYCKYCFRYNISTECMGGGNFIKATVSDVTKYNAIVNLDRSHFYPDESAEFKVKYREKGETDYTYANGGSPVTFTDDKYTLNGLSQGTTYELVIEGAYPTFANPEEEVESSKLSFTTQTSGGEICGFRFTKDTHWFEVNYETLFSGDVIASIAGCDYSGDVTFHKESLTENASKYYVTIGDNKYDASNYFENPVLIEDAHKFLMKLKSGVTPQDLAGAVITINTNGAVMSWWEMNADGSKKTQYYVNSASDFENFHYTYGTYCCALGALRLELASYDRFSASFNAMNNCIDGDGITYTYNFKYRKANSGDDFTSAYSGDWKTNYTLSDLIPNTEYEVVLEAINTEAGRYESSTVNFTTIKPGSETCYVPFTKDGCTIEITMETFTNGEVRMIISGDEANTRFRTGGAVEDISKFKLNAEAASNYFNNPVMSDDRTYVTLTPKATIPEGAILYFTGTLPWETAVHTNMWYDNASVLHTYGTYCCIAGRAVLAFAPETGLHTATVQTNDDCLYGLGYVYRLRYKGELESDYHIINGRESDGIYNLTDLMSDTEYEAYFEAAKPSFDDPEEPLESYLFNFTTKSAGSEICGIPYTSGNSHIEFNIETLSNGDLYVSITSDEANLRFRNDEGCVKIGNYKVGDEDASVYFEEADVTERTTTPHATFKLKDGKSIAEGTQISFNGVIAWYSSVNDGAWVSDVSAVHSYGTYCCTDDKLVNATVSEIAKHTANINVIDKCIAGNGYAYRVKYNIKGSQTVETIDGYPTGGVYQLQNLRSGSKYQAVVEAAFPNFDSPAKFASSSVVEFDTEMPGSEVCDRQFENGGNKIGISFETLGSGAVLISLVSSDIADAKFKKEAMVDEVKYYDIVTGGETVPASTYFENPVLADDKLSATMNLKTGAVLPDDAVIVLSSETGGKIVWTENGETVTRWVDSQDQFVDFKHTYGTVCCTTSDKKLQANARNITTSTADVKIFDDCILGNGYEYKLTYNVKGSDIKTTINGRPDDGIYTLENLHNGTTYQAIATAAYPSLASAEETLTAEVEFTTKSFSSEACKVMIQNEGKTEACYISMETDYQGNLVVSITGDEGEDVTFRTDGASIDENLNGYKVISNAGATEEAASEYFNTYIKSEDKKSSTFKLKADKTLPQDAVIKYEGIISWRNGDENPYATSQTISHTYGTWCCEADGFKIVRCEGTSPTTAVVRIDNLCISDANFKYQYSLKKEGGEYGEPQTFPIPELTLNNLEKGATYYVKVEAAYPDFNKYEIYKSDEASFETTSLEPAPVPTYSADVVTSVYSSTYGTQTFVNWMYYSNAESVTDVVLSSASTLKKFDMKGGPGQNADNGAMIEIAEGGNKLDLNDRMFVRFDMFISEEDAETAPYVSMNIRNADGAQDKWIQLGEVTPNEWNTFTIDIDRFVTEGDLGAEKLAKALLIVPFADPDAEGDARFPSKPYTFYLDNLLFYTYSVKIGTQYYETLAGALEAVQDGETIDLLASVKDDLVVDEKSFNVNANGKSVNNITISETGSLTLTSDINIKGDFILKSGVSESGSLFADENSMTVAGNAYFDKQFTNGANSMVWYGLSLPFAVDVNEVYSAVEPYENLPYYEQWALQDYNGALRADGVTGWDWVEPSSGLQMQSGKLYSLVVNQFAKYKALRFKAADKSELFASTTIPLIHYTGSGDTSDYGWNGIGNNQLYKAKMVTEAVYGQVIDVAKQDYTPVYFDAYTFAPGECVFVQSTSDGQEVELSASSLKSAEVKVNPFAVLISAKGSDVFDRSYVSASSDASADYELGKDLAEIGNYNSGNFVSMWIEAYGKALACADLKMYGGVAETAIGLYAPKAGNYRIYLEQAAEGQELILTKNGAEIFNFANGEYEFALSKGINAGYGLKVVSTDIPTDATNGEAGDINVYSKNGILYISGLTEGTPYLITNMFANVAEGISNGNVEQIALPTGIYGVLINGKCIKIVEQ